MHRCRLCGAHTGPVTRTMTRRPSGRSARIVGWPLCHALLPMLMGHLGSAGVHLMVPKGYASSPVHGAVMDKHRDMHTGLVDTHTNEMGMHYYKTGFT